MLDRAGAGPSTPTGRSRTSQPWQYGQCRKSRPQRSRAPSISSGSTSAAPVASSTWRAVTARPPASAARIRRRVDDAVLDELDAVAQRPRRGRREQLGRGSPVAGEEALHVRGRGVARRAGVDDDHAAPGAAEHERRGQAGGAAADDRHVIGLRFGFGVHAHSVEAGGADGRFRCGFWESPVASRHGGLVGDAGRAGRGRPPAAAAAGTARA